MCQQLTRVRRAHVNDEQFRTEFLYGIRGTKYRQSCGKNEIGNQLILLDRTLTADENVQVSPMWHWAIFILRAFIFVE